MIITNNIDLLRTKCENVIEEEVTYLIEKLEEELIHSANLGVPGIGLAAPQIGIYKKIAIVRLGDIKINLVNCNIEKKYDPFLFKEEGCLSFPGKLENTIRFQEVYVTNNLVYPHSFVANGLLSVVCQHEIDHFNSSLFIDHLAPKVNKPVVKAKPNDLCPCGVKDSKTGLVLKFKKCCGK